MRVTLGLVLFVTVSFVAAANGAPAQETSVELVEEEFKPFGKLSIDDIVKTDADDQKKSASSVDKFFDHLDRGAKKIGEFGRKATAKTQEIIKTVIQISEGARETIRRVHEATDKAKTIWQRIVDFFRG